MRPGLALRSQARALGLGADAGDAGLRRVRAAATAPACGGSLSHLDAARAARSSAAVACSGADAGLAADQRGAGQHRDVLGHGAAALAELGAFTAAWAFGVPRAAFTTRRPAPRPRLPRR